MVTVTELADRISALTIAEAVAVRRLLRERYGIELTARHPGGNPPTPELPTHPVGPPTTPTEFDVVLDGADPAKKLTVIRLVRELTGQGLAEAKATVEGGPKAIKEGVDKQTAEELRKKLEEAGGRVSVRPA